MRITKFLTALFILCVISFVAVLTTIAVKEISDQKLIEIHVSTKEEIRQRMIDEVQQYIGRVAPFSELSADTIVDICIKYNISPSFVLSQGQIESHFGTRGIAAKTNSVFNVNSFDGLSASQILASGKGYSHVNASVEPYVRNLKNNYLVNKTENDLLKNFVNKYGYRYASDRNYEKNLSRMVRKINASTNIEQLFVQYKELDKITYKVKSWPI